MIDNRPAPVYMALLPGFGHNSLTDNPLIYPDNFRSDIDAGEGLNVGRQLLLTYFNAQLMGKGGLKDDLGKIEPVDLRVHE
jgi:hypothetical protein